MSDPIRFDDRVAIVTGAGAGLGKSHARLLAARGAKVVVNDLGLPTSGGGNADSSVAQSVVDEIRAAGGDAAANTSSVADTAGADAIIEQALDTYGKIDIIVNNAGITGQGTLSAPDVWERLVATHLLGTANVLRAAWPHLRKQGYARVVNTASSSFFGSPASGDYAAAKGGVIALSKVLATDNTDWDLRINVLMPMGNTRMADTLEDKVLRDWYARYFQLEKVSAFVAVLCHEDVTCTGETFTAGGGRAARVLFQTTAGWFEPDPTPEAFREHFADVMAGADPRVATSGAGDLIRYVELLGDPGPFQQSGLTA
jgi:NAD(P)-dependent dehydrogenase (short-subunit alcohol dehydrogenase family)